MLANDSSVVSVIPYNDEVYCQLNDPKSYESQTLPASNFIRVGHVNAFVLKSTNGNYSEIFKKILDICLENDAMKNKIIKIESVNKYLEYYSQNLELDITEINDEKLLLSTATNLYKTNTNNY